jgi:hypothetical protein
LIPNYSFQTKDVFLSPYNKAWKATNVSPTVLSDIWRQLESDDLLDTAFPGMGDVSHDSVVSFMAHRQAQLLWKKTAGEPELMGFSFIDSADGKVGARKALFGFAFFRKYWGTLENRQLLYLMLAYWFAQCQIDVLFGITLRSNRLARNIARKYGFKELADIPQFLYCNGELADATLVMLDRHTYAPRFHEWHKRTLEAMRKEV